jgi:CHASE3 domain sensor protein
MMTDARDQQAILRRQLVSALLTPLLMLVAVGGLLGWQVARMAETARWVDHTDEVIAKANEAFRAILDQESALRGYLLTSDQATLEPYHLARPLETLQELRSLVADNPPQQSRLDDLRHHYELWAADATTTIARGAPTERASVAEGVLVRKRRMDAIRAEFRRIIEVELTLRRDRVVSTAAATRATAWAFVGLISLLGLALVLLSRRQLSAIASTDGEALTREQQARAAIEAQDWVRTGRRKLSEAIQGDLTTAELATKALGELARYVRGRRGGRGGNPRGVQAGARAGRAGGGRGQAQAPARGAGRLPEGALGRGRAGALRDRDRAGALRRRSARGGRARLLAEGRGARGRQIVRGHGGRVSARSDGEGVTFLVELPRRP